MESVPSGWASVGRAPFHHTQFASSLITTRTGGGLENSPDSPGWATFRLSAADRGTPADQRSIARCDIYLPTCYWDEKETPNRSLRDSSLGQMRGKIRSWVCGSLRVSYYSGGCPVQSQIACGQPVPETLSSPGICKEGDVESVSWSCKTAS